MLPMRTFRAAPSTEALSRVFWHLFRITISFSLLFVDNTILLVTAALSRLRSVANRRLAAQRNVQFYPKTVLITGVGTPHGLALARTWDAEGHRVVGVDVADLDIPVRSGGGMSNSLRAFYRVPKDHYISRILDIVHREKVDVWIPCSPKATAMEDATARQVVESRTACRCIAFDTELTARFIRPDSFKHFLADRDLPVLECHQVQSRDSVHKILNRSPSKSYHMRRVSSSANEAAVILPKRTLSRTYSEVSEIAISKETPWVLQQQTRLGEFFADLLLVRGHVQAIKVRLVETRVPHWGASRLDEALATAVHRLMHRLAMKGGNRMTGHLSIRLLVDEEFDTSSVRHTIHIADCVPGAKAVENLLRDARCPVAGYLEVLSPHPAEPAAWCVTATLSPNPRPRSTFLDSDILVALLPRFLPLNLIKATIAAAEAELTPFLFWKDPRFSPRDPFPWWWHVHVYQPMREIWMLVKQTRTTGLPNGPVGS
ncbi:O-methyltransferase family 3 [Penicillium canariense]|uniref:O-methyltransferase family 3 n=1 Tax=Penicillium canariense TaxID=189055 RepID=A0A9W9IJX8_9EURO|nr:O-methyltransferase family 3 [Penicillium canariense]KAJ5177061.1 O-methyltransferase family 3 [Penicillium canariense]